MAKVSINNPGQLPVIIFSCGQYKQMVINPAHTEEIELNGVLAVGAEAEKEYYESLNGFQGLVVTADTSDPVKVSINNPGSLPVIIFDCGRYKQLVIEPNGTEELTMTGVQYVSADAQKKYYMDMNGYQGLVITEVTDTDTQSLDDVVPVADDNGSEEQPTEVTE